MKAALRNLGKSEARLALRLGAVTSAWCRWRHWKLEGGPARGPGGAETDSSFQRE